MSTEESKSASYLLFALTMSGTKRWGTQQNGQDRLIYGVKPEDWKDIYKAMLNNEEYDDNEFELNFEEEAEVLTAAYENTYLIVTKRITLEELLTDHLDSGDFLFLPFDPGVPYTLDLIIDDVIEHFENCEEYEKCAELVKLKEQDDT